MLAIDPLRAARLCSPREMSFVEFLEAVGRLAHAFRRIRGGAGGDAAVHRPDEGAGFATDDAGNGAAAFDDGGAGEDRAAGVFVDALLAGIDEDLTSQTVSEKLGYVIKCLVRTLPAHKRR